MKFEIELVFGVVWVSTNPNIPKDEPGGNGRPEIGMGAEESGQGEWSGRVGQWHGNDTRHAIRFPNNGQLGKRSGSDAHSGKNEFGGAARQSQVTRHSQRHLNENERKDASPTLSVLTDDPSLLASNRCH